MAFLQSPHFPVSSPLHPLIFKTLEMFPINFPANQVTGVDPDVWKACAGESFFVPEVGSVVYYFPEAHANQSDSSPAIPPPVWPFFRCSVLNVRLLADRASDEVFGAVLLHQAPTGSSGGGRRREGLGKRIDSYVKFLTHSDANNGGGFSVPKQCAESIFPALDYNEDPPVQNLTITDVQGVDWAFRHIFRGTPKRHLLTTGWSKFVNHKNLIAGDTVIFMRDNVTRKLYIGIWRVDKGGGNGARFGSGSLHRGVVGGNGDLEDEVEAAAMHAAEGKPFEIIIDPRNGPLDFLVNTDVVDRALSLRWDQGMWVKMRVETDNESSRPTWRRGYVSLVFNSQENGQWQSSPWKMLQVTWVESEHMQNVERLSPWQVELAEPSVPLQPTYYLTELKGPQCFQPLIARNGEPHFMMGLGDPRSGLLNSTLFKSNTQLASMQGARHLSDVSVLTEGDTHQISRDDMFQRGELSLFGSRITNLNHGGHWSGNFSAESPSSLHSFGTEIGNLSSPPSGISSIQLFGKLIYVSNFVESQSGDASCLETDISSKGDIETGGV